MKNTISDNIRIKVAEYKIAECRDMLDNFGRMPYRYKGKSLFVDYHEGLAGDHAQGRLILADDAKGNGVVPLSPDICGSFAIWPKDDARGGNLLDVCKDEVLRPQFVFLALNWSNKIKLVGNKGKLDSPCDYFNAMPRWNNFHNLSVGSRQFKKSHLVESFENGNPLRGAYMTDFAKGIVSPDSTGVYKFLRGDKSNVEGLDVCPFMWFVEILREELKALDEAFGNPDVPKFLIVYGPTIYNNLQNMARQFAGQSLEALFPDRTILRTGSFYNNIHGFTVGDYRKHLREIHYFPRHSEPIHVNDLQFDQVR